MKKLFLGFQKKLKRFLYSHINGGKGMISIFLALTVSPLLMCTLIFVEYARIQSAQAIIEELMGSSIFSALAHYDPYLDERFGFMAVRQDQEESLDSGSERPRLRKGHQLIGRNSRGKKFAY